MDFCAIDKAFKIACRTTLDLPGSPAAEAAQADLVHLISAAIKKNTTIDADYTAASIEENYAQLHKLLQFLEEHFSSPLPGAEEVLELAMTDLLADMLSCQNASKQLAHSVGRLMSRMASTFHPRDTITAFLGHMQSGFGFVACSLFDLSINSQLNCKTKKAKSYSKDRSLLLLIPAQKRDISQPPVVNIDTIL